MCKCELFEDLPLDLAAIMGRVNKYNDMRPMLKQLTQKVVERWVEHYRLYKCEECGQYWQSSLAPRDDETWYLFKVPKITQKSWKQQPYIAPDMIMEYLAGKEEFMARKFDLRKEGCIEEGCNERAISGLNKCMLHQFLQLGGNVHHESLINMRWFGPYRAEQIKH